MHASRRIGRGNWSNYVVGIYLVFYSNGGRIPIPGIWGLIEGHRGLKLVRNTARKPPKSLPA